MSDGGATFFVQAELTEQFGFVGGRIIGLAQKGEQAFAKGHIKFRAAARAPRFEIGLTKERSLVLSDENRPCRQ